MNIISKIRIFLISTFLFSVMVGCNKDKYERVPDVPVNVKINIHSHLTFMGYGETVMILPNENNVGYIKFNDDSRANINLTSKVYGYGIVLYRYDQEVFVAYDRTCTFRPESNYCGIEFDKSGILPTCPCCSSRFIVSFAGEATGYPTSESQAAFALLQYRTTVSNGWLTISKY
jgi:hypothetical protein